MSSEGISKKEIRRKTKELFNGREIIFNPNLSDINLMDTGVAASGEIGYVSDLAYPGKRMFNNASGWHSVVLDFRTEYANFDGSVIRGQWCYKINEIYAIIKPPTPCA